MPSSLSRRFTPMPATGSEAQMFEPLIGLTVGVLLAIYLIVTLVRPERF